MARRLSAAGLLLAAAMLVGPGAYAATRARFSAPVEMYVSSVPFRVAAADFNTDGIPDLATADNRAKRVSVLLGRGDGSFRAARGYRTVGGPADVAAADINADGDADLIAAGDSASGYMTVLLGDGTGHLHRSGVYPAGSKAPALALADTNHDGLTDILAAVIGPQNLAVLLGTGGGHFAPARHYGNAYSALDNDVADVNHDGNPDVALATGEYGDALMVFLGHGDGSFAAPQIIPAGRDPSGVTIADVTADGNPDLLAINFEADRDLRVLRGLGDGNFASTPLTHDMTVGGEYVLAADFDADGRTDVATSSIEGAPAVASGRGNGKFEKARSLEWFYYQGGAVADFNADGRPDIAMAASDSPEVNVFLNWTGRPAAPCVVMDVRRERRSTAISDLHDANCRIGTITRRRARNLRGGRIIRTRPRYGTVLAPRHRVNLIISRGRRR